MSVTVTTLTSGYFQHYIPMFIYTLRKNVPDVMVKVFHRGKLDELTNRTLGVMHDAGMNFDPPTEEMFPEYPDNDFTTNCLRFMIAPSYFRNSEHVYITDVDFAFFSHDPSMAKYYVSKMQKWEECYWSRRGPRRAKGTDDVVKRISAGCFLASKGWYEKTKPLRERMAEKVMSGELGKVREDDERMLWDICAGSGLKCPTAATSGRKTKYKDLHIGDFKFDTRWKSNRKMKQRINKGNFFKWHRLEEDSLWKKVVGMCCEDRAVDEMIRNVRFYMIKRKSRMVPKDG